MLHLFSTKVAFMRTFDCEGLGTTYFSFARPKVKIFRTSTSNRVRALSYLAAAVKLLACKPTVSSQITLRHN